MLIALDFGTTGSGFAVAFGDRRRQPLIRERWPGTTAVYPKTRSDLLVGPDGKLVAWGWEAIHEHTRLRSTHRRAVIGDPDPRRVRELPSLVTRIKLALRDGTLQRGRLSHVDAAGRAFDVVDLIGQYLAALANAAFDHVERRLGVRPDAEKVSWCLTVPAIWTEREKSLMRSAAVRAGLIPAQDRSRLSLVLEPEAAAVACLAYRRNETSTPVPDGTRFLLVDAGGGTVDLTMHDVDGNGLRECVPGDGDARSGSTFVDLEFQKALIRRLGSVTYDRLQATEPMVLQNLRDAWEPAKCIFDGHRDVHIDFTAATRKVLHRVDPEFFKRLEKEQRGEADVLIFPAAEVRGMFEPVLDRVVALVRRHVEGARRPPSLVFLVGGFAESPLLQQAIRGALEGIVEEVVVPSRPAQAVLEGAALLGIDPDVVFARVSRYTYGTHLYGIWDEHLDPPERKVWLEDIQAHRCRGRFKKFVGRGQAVGREETFTYSSLTVRKLQARITFEIYRTLDDEPRYVDDLTRIGEVSVEFPTPSPEAGREVALTFRFGSTEILVTARDMVTGTEAHTTVDFERAAGLEG